MLFVWNANYSKLKICNFYMLSVLSCNLQYLIHVLIVRLVQSTNTGNANNEGLYEVEEMGFTIETV